MRFIDSYLSHAYRQERARVDQAHRLSHQDIAQYVLMMVETLAFVASPLVLAWVMLESRRGSVTLWLEVSLLWFAIGAPLLRPVIQRHRYPLLGRRRRPSALDRTVAVVARLVALEFLLVGLVLSLVVKWSVQPITHSVTFAGVVFLAFVVARRRVLRWLHLKLANRELAGAGGPL